MASSSNVPIEDPDIIELSEQVAQPAQAEEPERKKRQQENVSGNVPENDQQEESKRKVCKVGQFLPLNPIKKHIDKTELLVQRHYSVPIVHPHDVYTEAVLFKMESKCYVGLFDATRGNASIPAFAVSVTEGCYEYFRTNGIVGPSKQIITSSSNCSTAENVFFGFQTETLKALICFVVSDIMGKQFTLATNVQSSSITENYFGNYNLLNIPIKFSININPIPIRSAVPDPTGFSSALPKPPITSAQPPNSKEKYAFVKGLRLAHSP